MRPLSWQSFLLLTHIVVDHTTPRYLTPQLEAVPSRKQRSSQIRPLPANRPRGSRKAPPPPGRPLSPPPTDPLHQEPSPVLGAEKLEQTTIKFEPVETRPLTPPPSDRVRQRASMSVDHPFRTQDQPFRNQEKRVSQRQQSFRSPGTTRQTFRAPEGSTESHRVGEPVDPSQRTSAFPVPQAPPYGTEASRRTQSVMPPPRTRPQMRIDVSDVQRPHQDEPDFGIVSPNDAYATSSLASPQALGFIIPPLVADPVLQHTLDSIAEQVNQLVPVHNAQQQQTLGSIVDESKPLPQLPAPLVRHETMAPPVVPRRDSNAAQRRDGDKENAPVRTNPETGAPLAPVWRHKADEMPGTYHTVRGQPNLPLSKPATPLLSQENAEGVSVSVADASNTALTVQVGRRKSGRGEWGYRQITLRSEH